MTDKRQSSDSHTVSEAGARSYFPFGHIGVGVKTDAVRSVFFGEWKVCGFPLPAVFRKKDSPALATISEIYY
ncbi:MAG: hypothetical protein K2L27_07370 [Muribaculaceae bacterium]|nr:hypothetical protein [Muribaculaceae bacterium]